jgi:hypothetical protein
MSDNLSFGNPTKDLQIILKQDNYLDSLLVELKSYPPPQNNSDETTKELQLVVSYIDALLQNQILQKRYLIYDADFKNYIADSLANVGIDKNEVQNIITSISDDIAPLLMKIKFHYQRIRPHQLAYYYNLPLYPFNTCTVNSPSYPSGHSFQAKVYALVLGNLYPKFYQPLQDLADDITKSRIYLGVHYPSDCNFAYYMADLVVSHTDFKRKYKL